MRIILLGGKNGQNKNPSELDRNENDLIKTEDIILEWTAVCDK